MNATPHRTVLIAIGGIAILIPASFLPALLAPSEATAPPEIELPIERDAPPPHPQSGAWLEQLEEATAVEIEVIAAEIETAALPPDAAVTANLLDALGVAWARVGRYDEALARFERLAAEHPDRAGDAWLKVAWIHGKREDREAEIAALKRSIRGPGLDTHRDLMDADNTTNIAHRWLASIYERRGNWAAALALWTRWEPRSWCGNEARTYAHQRTLGMARCRFRLKSFDQALDAIRELVWERDCLNGIHPDIAFLYVELMAEADRLEDARREFERLPSDRRERFQVAVAMQDAVEAEDPARLLDVLAEVPWDGDSIWSVPFAFHAAAERIADLGDAGRAELERRIGRGDRRAVAVALRSGDAEWIEPLRDLARNKEVADPELAGFVRKVLERLDASGSSPGS